MRNLLLSAFVFLAAVAFAKEVDPDVTAQYAHYDFAPLLKPKKDFLGFIGTNYQRLYITFASVEKDPVDPTVYHVKGTSKVREHECTLDGTIKITKITRLKRMHYGVDGIKKGEVKSEGVLSGTYELTEPKDQAKGGTFRGKVTLGWYVDKKGKLHYDDIESDSDSFRNNQYEGVWNSHKIRAGETANWGEYRIPNSGDLDVGEGDFGADPKYQKQGW